MVIPENWAKKQLSDIVAMKSGETITSERIFDNAEYPCYGGNGLRGYTDKYTHEGEFALVGRQGALCGNVNYANGRFYASEHAVVVTPYNNTDIRFMYYLLTAMNLNQYATSSAQPGLAVNKILELECVVPESKAEQKAISIALTDIDNLISTQEALIAKKQAIKQGAMQELLTGKRRLAGFTGFWQEKSFYEVFDILPNNTFPRDKMQSQSGTIVNIHYGDVLIKYGELLDCQNCDVPYLLDDIIINNNRCFAKSGDVIIADTAEDETVGKVTELVNVNGLKVVSGLHTFLCRPKDEDEFALGWLGYYMNAERYHKQILTYVTGIKVSSISKANIANTVIEIPTKEEQNAIVNVLKDMDYDIANQQAKLEKLRRIKSGMMDKLLTGKIRLTD